MTTPRDEREARAWFDERYAIRGPGVAAEIERRVIGATWGVNGYTTLAQAEELRRRLALGPGDVLLDVGTGRGWPGLFLAATTGCSVIGADLPFEGLRAATRRAGREGLDGRAAMVLAGASALPFRAESFDGVVLTDVL
jgi:2-polyprenyl-3-methyl-5-hydroxy-6-metoxy-1,4-benzoquinol methylase